MRRSELSHILRAASTISGDPEIVVIGSQSILGSHSEDELPEAAHASIEVDLAFFDDVDNEKSDSVDAVMGEDSQFHVTHGYYAQGVEIATAVLPRGWRDRMVTYSDEESGGATAHCLEKHDLVVSKLVASRDKDFAFACALIDAELVEVDTLLERAQDLEVPMSRKAVLGWLVSWVKKYGAGPRP